MFILENRATNLLSRPNDNFDLTPNISLSKICTTCTCINMYDFVSKDYEFQGGGLSNSTSQKGSNKLRQI